MSIFYPHNGQQCRIASKLPSNSILYGKYIIEESLEEEPDTNNYLAWKCSDSHKKVLIKQCKYRGDDSQGVMAIRRRMEREFRLLAALNFPGIPTVYEFFQVDDVLYVVQEYRRGVSLKTLIKGNLNFRLMENICWQLLDILEYLHINGIVLGNLDPSGMIVDEEGNLLVTNFESACLMESGKKINISPERNPGFLAPELYGLYPATVSSDTYSFGALLYYMFTGDDPGRNPFGIGSSSNINSRINHRGVAGFLIRCLNYDPLKRFQSVKDARIVLFGGGLFDPPEGEKEKIVELCWGSDNYRNFKYMEKAIYTVLIVWMAAIFMVISFTGYGRKLLSNFTGKVKNKLSKRNIRENIKHIAKKEHKYLAEGRKYYLNQDYAHAINCFDSAIVENPKFAQAYLMRSFCYRETGKIDRALADLDKAAKLEPHKKKKYEAIRKNMIAD